MNCMVITPICAHSMQHCPCVVSGSSRIVLRLDWSPITGPKGNIEFIAEMRKGNEKTKAVTVERAAELVREAHASLGGR